MKRARRGLRVAALAAYCCLFVACPAEILAATGSVAGKPKPTKSDTRASDKSTAKIQARDQAKEPTRGPASRNKPEEPRKKTPAEKDTAPSTRSSGDRDLHERMTATKDREERRVSLVRAESRDDRDQDADGSKGSRDKRGKKKRVRPIRPLPPNASWAKYRATPWKRGYVTVQGHGKKWSGMLVDSAGDVIPSARREISEALSSWRTGHQMLMDERLLALVADTSDEFGGRPVRIVSGYREHSYAPDSKHKVGQAFDFSVPGVPNEQLRDFLRSLPDVGVGFYPNSTHVHLDVREAKCYWIDYSGPGESPMYSYAKRTLKGFTAAERALASALEAIARHPLRSSPAAETPYKPAPSRAKEDDDAPEERALSHTARELPDGGAPRAASSNTGGDAGAPRSAATIPDAGAPRSTATLPDAGAAFPGLH